MQTDLSHGSDGYPLAEFVAAFPKGRRPHPFRRETVALEDFYAALPPQLSPLPPLYERLILRQTDALWV